MKAYVKRPKIYETVRNVSEGNVILSDAAKVTTLITNDSNINGNFSNEVVMTVNTSESTNKAADNTNINS